MRGNPFTRFFRAVSVLMLLIAAALLSAITTMHFAIHGAEVKIPPLKGMTVAEARSQAAGLGLNLAKRIIEAHGGVLVLHSEVGKGTELLATIPGVSEKEIQDEAPEYR